MENDKKILEELFQYGNRILLELKSASEKKSGDIDNLIHRHENLKQRLKNLLSELND